MPTPRTRQPSVSQPWPHLSLLSVYSATPLLDPHSSTSKKPSDEELEAAKILYFHHESSTTGNAVELTPERKRRLMGIVMGVSDFAKMMTKSGKDNKIKSVKSSKRRMIWIEPEEGIFVHATIAIPRQSSKRHARETSAATTSSSRSFPSSGTSQYPLDDQLLITALETAYESFRLHHGKVSTKLEKEGKEKTMSVLEGFWSRWVENWDLASYANSPRVINQVLRGLPMSPLLNPSTRSQLDPLLNQFSASNPSICPLILHSTSVLHLPSPNDSFLDSRTLSSLASDLLTLHSIRLEAALAALSDVGHSNSASHETTIASSGGGGASSSSIWSSSALSYFDPRNVPLPSFSSSSTTTSFLLNPFSSTTTTTTISSSEGAGARLSSQEGDSLKKEFDRLRKETRRIRKDSNTPSFGSSTDGGSTSLRSRKEGSSREQRTANTIEGENEEKGQEEGAGGGSGWGLRSVSKSWNRLGAALSGGGSGSQSPEMVPPVPVLPPKEQQEDSQGGLTGTPTPITKSIDAGATEAEGAIIDSSTGRDELDGKAEEVVEGPKTPGTPAVELAPDVNEEDLMEAMNAMEVEANPSETVANVEGVTPAEEGEQEIAKEKDLVLRFFGGEQDHPFEVRLIERSSLTLALVSHPVENSSPPIDLDLLSNRAARLLEAVETVLDSATPPTSASRDQPTSVIKLEGLLYSQPSLPARNGEGTKTSSDSDSSRDSDLETTHAFLDAHRSINSSRPEILESLTRLPTSSTWLSLTRSFHFFPSSSPSSAADLPPEDEEKPIEVLAILPAKNPRGRETTLVEAAEGARRIERKWVARRCGP